MRVPAAAKTSYLVFGLPMVAVLTLCVHMIGTVVLIAVAEGPHRILASPVLAVFGLFWLPIEFVLVSAQWLLLAAFSFTDRACRWILATSILAVPTLFALVAGKEMGSEVRWAIGYWLGAAAAGAFSFAGLAFYLHMIKGFINHQEPNRSVAADHDPRERGSRPLNSNR